MSVSLILVPAALAVAGIVGGIAATGVHSQSEADHTEAAPSPSGAATPLQVQTRMKDADLLASALRDLGAVRVKETGGELSALVGDLSLRMTRDEDGIWTAHVAGADGRDADVTDATGLIERMDAAYARRVQQEVAARIRARADDAGFELLSESREQDDSVTMVLSVREQR